MEKELTNRIEHVIESFECDLILSLDLGSIPLQKFQSCFFCRTHVSFLVVTLSSALGRFVWATKKKWEREKKIAKEKCTRRSYKEQ